MNTYNPTYWLKNSDANDTAQHLTAMVPQVGEIVSVFLPDEQCPHEGEIAGFIWKPALSEINGWSEQPSEIGDSNIIVATVRKAQSGNRAGLPQFIQECVIAKSIEWQLDVHECTPFLLACAQSAAAAISQLGTTNAFLSSGESHWSGVADIQGYIYLCANWYEEHLEMLLKKEEGKLASYFQEWDYPGGVEIDIGRRLLSTAETAGAQKIIASAVALRDTTYPIVD